MRALSPSSSIQRYWEDLTYVEAALLANDDTKALAAVVSVSLAEFEQVSKRDLDTRRAVIQSRARSSVADGNLDESLRHVHANTLHLVRQDRSQREYTTAFPGALTGLIRHALAKQIVAARELVERLGLSVYAADFRDAQVALITPMITKGEVVIDERRDAELGRVEGRIELETWKEDANAVRMSVYAQLLGIASKSKRKRSWAESFFPASTSRSKSDDSDELDGDEIERDDVESE
jgi:hypothetical protein